MTDITNYTGRKARVIALYLPQFHPIKENDLYWGKGFTEWTNVVQARPLFRGHEQPRIPADLGFYDLRYPEIKEQQANLARDAGIEGFCYWQYWFGNGKMLLEKPFEQVIETGKPDFPFCLGWANHSWTTGTWLKGGRKLEKQMIAEQLYPGEEDYIAHFNYCLPAFKDKRYIQVDGKPFFAIFDTQASSEIPKFINLWQDLARQNGLKGIHFVGMNNTGKTPEDLMTLGFDAINNRKMDITRTAVSGSHLKSAIANRLSKYLNIPAMKYEYKKFVASLFTADDLKEYCYPTIIPNYDRSPRAGSRGIITYGSTPELFRAHVQDTLDKIMHKPFEHRIIILKSWNEWGETNYIEPDRTYGTDYLDALKKVISQQP